MQDFMLRLFLGLSAITLSACGSWLDHKAALVVEAYGVDSLDASGTGTTSSTGTAPQAITLSIQRIQASTASGQSVTLWENTAGTTTRLIDRPLILAKIDLEDYKDTTFNSLTITFGSSNFTAHDDHNQDIAGTLSTLSVTSQSPFTITDTTETINFHAKVGWGGILSEGSASSPSFALVME